MYDKLLEYNYLFDKAERKELTAEAIKAFRIEANLQQKEVAELLKINTQTYQSYENGRCEPPLEILVRISLLYDVSIDDIVQKTKRKIYKNLHTEIATKYGILNIEQLKKLLPKLDPVTRAKLSPRIKAFEEMFETFWDDCDKNAPDFLKNSANYNEDTDE